ncbi:MAG: hypothetical protein CMB62_01315 [Euryarchaeota archaeon]|nr:hypothetical protein [Euryarchaeota archaeon]|tara:strand:- start:514 stop:1809 length:1296 start_codon:yes stop_codon:yes gene_type:complete
MLHIGIDDTDSLDGGCTTWLITEIIAELSDFDLVAPPRLVRLNPNVPWKTRGNGSLALVFGEGIGSKQLIGEIENKKIYFYSNFKEKSFDKKNILERISKIVIKQSKKDSQPGIVISDTFLPEGLYWQGVRGIVSEEDLDPILSNCLTFGLRGSRGLFGAACALAWSGYHSHGRDLNFTWELIGYRDKNLWGTLRNISLETVSQVSKLEGVFSCNDPDGKVAMVPNSPCPVLWGFRGTDEQILVANFQKLGPEKPVRWFLYQTNQATDDHFCFSDTLDIVDGTSIWIDVKISSKIETIKGGHRFVQVEDFEGNEARCAVFEPSKNLRNIVDKLEIGDEITVCGSVNENTINIEKLRIISLIPRYSKPPNPLCSCGKRTHSSGKNTKYRCNSCGKKYERPSPIPELPNLELGWFEPPASSRRHLTKPIELMR